MMHCNQTVMANIKYTKVEQNVPFPRINETAYDAFEVYE